MSKLRLMIVLLSALILTYCAPGRSGTDGLDTAGSGDPQGDDDSLGADGAAQGGEEGEDEGEAEAGNPHHRLESCDQLDNNGDGLVDDICGCVVGTTQPCYRGHVTTRGLGVCRDGEQPCDADDPEFPHWGDCSGDLLPGDEACGDGLDNDCDGVTDEGCEDSGCGPGDIPEPEVCDSGADEDCDGLVDCDDSDCDCELPDDGHDSPCDDVAEFGDRACSDGCDNDDNGRTDCEDFPCWLSNECRDCEDSEATAEACTDGHDNDCDWMTDCADGECQQLGQEVCPTECTPGECRWWHVCACCEDPDGSECPYDSCDSPHSKWYSCVAGYWEYAGQQQDCQPEDLPPGCDSIGL